MNEMSFVTAKPGQGCSVFAACAAIGSPHERTLLVDWGGDLPAVLGIAQPSDENYLPIQINDRLWLASPHGYCDYGDLEEGFDCIMHDWGTVDDLSVAPGDVYLVIQPCYLALRRATKFFDAPEIKGIIVHTQPGRALTSRDISRAIGAPVISEYLTDPAVARAVDAGILATRLARSITQAAHGSLFGAPTND